MKRTLAGLLSLIGLLPFLGAALAQGDGDWGTIKGRVIWGGDKIPPQLEIKLPPENQETAKCIQANKNKLPPDETWVVNKDNKGLKNTFVWLVDFNNPKAKTPVPTHPSLKDAKDKQVEIDQPACHFIPYALALRESQTLLVKNSAAFTHNFKWTGNPLTINNGNVLLPPGASHPVTLEADRLPVLVECNIHPWMKGYIRVFNHPYFAVTDENGAFEFKNAPAGKYRLMVWHGSGGWKGGAAGNMGEPVDIKKADVTDLGAIAYPPP
jgi:hypothetical protein